MQVEKLSLSALSVTTLAPAPVADWIIKLSLQHHNNPIPACMRLHSQIEPIPKDYSPELRNAIFQMLERNPNKRATAAQILETQMMQVNDDTHH